MHATLLMSLVAEKSIINLLAKFRQSIIFIVNISNDPSSYCNNVNHNYFQYQVQPMLAQNQYYINNAGYQYQMMQLPFLNQQFNYVTQTNSRIIRHTKKQNKTKHKRKEKKKEKKSQSSKSLLKRKEVEQAKSASEINCSDGVFHYLFNKCKTNPITLGLIGIEGNSYNPGWAKKLPRIIDPAFTSYWLPKSENGFFKIDFKTYSVKIKKYRLRVGNGSGDFLFKSWTLFGTTESNQEIILSDTNNAMEITSSHPETTIDVNSETYVSSIKLTIKGSGLADMGTIELYGILKQKK